MSQSADEECISPEYRQLMFTCNTPSCLAERSPGTNKTMPTMRCFKIVSIRKHASTSDLSFTQVLRFFRNAKALNPFVSIYMPEADRDTFVYLSIKAYSTTKKTLVPSEAPLGIFF
jgi:hypothetical protein